MKRSRVVCPPVQLAEQRGSSHVEGGEQTSHPAPSGCRPISIDPRSAGANNRNALGPDRMRVAHTAALLLLSETSPVTPVNCELVHPEGHSQDRTSTCPRTTGRKRVRLRLSDVFQVFQVGTTASARDSVSRLARPLAN